MAVAVEPLAAKWEVPQIWLFFLVVVFKFFGLKFLLVFVLNLVHVFFFTVFTCWIFPGGPGTSIQNVQH